MRMCVVAMRRVGNTYSTAWGTTNTMQLQPPTRPSTIGGVIFQSIIIIGPRANTDTESGIIAYITAKYETWVSPSRP